MLTSRPGDPPSYYPLRYNLPGAVVYRGLLSVTGGQFAGDFIVPRDVTLGGDLGRVVAYFHDDDIDGIIARDSILYAGGVAASEDLLPPELRVYFENRSFRHGDKIGPDPLLIVELSDSSGLNLTSAMGHGITVDIDGVSTEELTPYFSYNRDDYRAGSLERRISLAPGRHHLEFAAWDSHNNLVVSDVEVEVSAAENGLIVGDVLNWPNPFNTTTQLTFRVNRPADYEIRIFTVAGRLIRDFRGRVTEAGGGIVGDVVWDARDSAGRHVGNGVYLFKVRATDSYGGEAAGLGKIVYAR